MTNDELLVAEKEVDLQKQDKLEQQTTAVFNGIAQVLQAISKKGDENNK
ncbi:hypothetical protein [Apilactobacillus micheneri]|nr:hypothetical protein [Apilactobacillus micheneri]